mgnify:CR=1 FL=1
MSRAFWNEEIETMSVAARYRLESARLREKFVDGARRKLAAIDVRHVVIERENTAAIDAIRHPLQRIRRGLILIQIDDGERKAQRRRAAPASRR